LIAACAFLVPEIISSEHCRRFGLPSIQSRIHKKLDRNWKDAMNRNPKNKFEVPGDIDHDRSDDICERCKQNPVRMRNVHRHLCEGCHQFVNGVLLLALLRFEQRLGELKAEQSDTGYYTLLENQRLKARCEIAENKWAQVSGINAELLEALQDCVEYMSHANRGSFDNGVVHQGRDEGDVLAGQAIDKPAVIEAARKPKFITHQ
jgi:hypothetical protein